MLFGAVVWTLGYQAGMFDAFAGAWALAVLWFTFQQAET